MTSLITRIVILASSLGSIYGLYFTFFPASIERSLFHWSLVGLSVILALILLAWDVIDYLRTRPKKFRTESQINKYLCTWLKSGGRSVILSRDLSWASDRSVQPVLMDKARRGELTIFLEKPTEVSDALKSLGADIRLYGNLGTIPRSRFTIVDYEKDGARVAIGLKVGDKHQIEEFRTGIHSTYAVAEDFARFMNASKLD